MADAHVVRRVAVLLNGHTTTLVGAPIIATGIGKATFESLAPKPGAALVAHVTVHGVVDLVSGGQAHVLGTARVTVLRDATPLFGEGRVRLTPL